MGAVIETFLVCNNCGKTFGVDNRTYTAKKHREGAKSEGWINVGKLDYCPECVQLVKSPETKPSKTT